MADSSLDARLAAIRPSAELICARLQAEIDKLKLPPRESRPRPLLDLVRFHTERDPYSGKESLVGLWSNAHGHRLGMLKFHGDGSFYAEFDVAEPHPSDARWFVEGVTAWGKGETIKSEPKFLEALE